ncbi:unnamed protein product [Urochloa decumbens]|uniref:Uncharacterized protein n=1 Tax=Urochloa decumbens TaxID=240449 RepID=A0ABC8XNM2_9POAL
MDSTGQLYRSPLLEEDNFLLENTLEWTGDGSVCIRGHPASKKHTGKWKASSLTIVCSFCSYLAISSISKNLVSYLTKVLHETNVVVARNVSAWQGTSFLSPLVGAFIADSYLGKYWTALIFFTIFIIGMMVLVLSTSLLISIDPQVWPAWTDTVSSQHIIFFLGLYMVAIGYGGQYPCVTSFGADQFDDTDEEERTQKSSFFNWNHFTLNAGALISGTIIVWIQDHEGWLWGFTIAALFVALGLGSFLLGSSVYRFQKPGGSPLARMCQVIVAATCNFDKDLPCDCSLLYEIPGQGSGIEGSRKLEHTTGLEFFDKAAIVTSADSLAQMFSTFIEQGMVMEKHIGSFEIPAASFQSVDVIAVLALVPVYERVLVPVFRKFTGMANGITPLQRMGIGLFFSTLSMVSAAMVESNRLRMVQDKGLVNQNVAAPMSILWQGPQYFLLGAGEVFSIIGLNEFFLQGIT